MATPQTVARGTGPDVTVSFGGLAPGTPVAGGAVTVQIAAGQTTRQSLTMESTIARVEITPNLASVQVGDDLTLTAMAKDGSGQTVLVPASGAFTWSVTAGGAYASVDPDTGVVTGAGEGSETVRATENESGVAGSVTVTATAPPGPTGVRYIVLSSYRAGGLGNGDIYLYDVQTQSLVDTPGLNNLAYGDYEPSISADGRCIASASDRSGGAGGIDVYLYDRQTQSMVDLPGLNASSSDESPCAR